MANDALTLAYNVPVQVRVSGLAADNTTERPIHDITWSASNVAIAITPTADPLIFSVVNGSPSGSGSASIFWSAKNELNTTIGSGAEAVTLVPANPATTLQAKTV